MRWYRMSEQEQSDLRKVQGLVWRRQFAWLPRHDPDSHIVYWLEFVWCRGSGNFTYTTVGKWFGHSWYNYTQWEYRGGRECPEIKQCPPNQKSKAASTVFDDWPT